MATGLQKSHSNLFQDAFKQGLQSYVSTSKQLTATSSAGTPVAGTFYSSIVNRAALVDISNDLRALIGIERIPVQSISLIQGEFGPNGELVFGVSGDDRGLIRLGGQWTSASDNNGSGARCPGANADFIEITFFGTGLNILQAQDTNSRSFTFSVDGGSTTSVTNSGSSVLNQRNYAQNTISNIVSGLGQGVHTVRIVSTSAAGIGLFFDGIEILNESSQVKINPGTAYIDGQKTSLALQNAFAYNSGVTGTKGGRQLVYLKSDATIGTAFQAVNAGIAYSTAADHTNEEVARVIHPREFGCGRTDDFNYMVSSGQAAAFTLEDGTTTLIASSAYIDSSTQALIQTSTNDFIQITFVGTGLDIYQQGSIGSVTQDMPITVDGVASTLPFALMQKNNYVKVCSGLPYGTHIVRFTRTVTGTMYAAIRKFLIYQPKKPTLPAGAIELADYNVMANFVPNTAGTISPSQGVLRKAGAREISYQGSWPNWSIDVSFASGWNFNNNQSAGASFTYVFFGTGIEHKQYFQASAISYSYSIDGNTNFAGLTTALYSQNPGSVTFNQATGLLSGTAGTGSSYGTTFSISGLPLGMHKLTVTVNNASFLYAESLDIITPVHSPRPIGSVDLQNTLPIGSCAISDNRQTSLIKSSDRPRKNFAQAVGVSISPTTTSSSWVPMPDMSVTLTTSGGRVMISYSASIYINSSGQATYTSIFIDGVQVGPMFSNYSPPTGPIPSSDTIVVNLAAGTHKIDVHWYTSGGYTGYAQTNYRSLVAMEI